MKTLIFHGSLRTLCPENLQVEAATVAEAISSLQHHPSFKVGAGIQHSVSIDGFSTRDAIYDRTDVTEIHIRPAMSGAGRNGMLQVIIGAIIIVAATIMAGPAGFTLSSGAMTGAGTAAMAGAMMMLGGIIQMLMPQPEISGMNAEEKSRYLSGAKNTVGIGTRIPLGYGTRKVYGHYISFDVDAGDLNKTPADWYASSFTQYDELKTGTIPVLSN